MTWQTATGVNEDEKTVNVLAKNGNRYTAETLASIYPDIEEELENATDDDKVWIDVEFDAGPAIVIETKTVEKGHYPSGDPIQEEQAAD
jgi:hypothetical protein